MKNNKDIELRSEEVQEVMGQVPAWIVRWGITLLFLVVVALLVGSCFFKYPDVITADMTLTGQHPATAVVTRAAGKIQELLVRDNRPVRQGDWLAVIENHADTDDAIYLDKALERSGSGLLGTTLGAPCLYQLQGDRLLSAKNDLHPQTDSVV